MSRTASRGAGLRRYTFGSTISADGGGFTEHADEALACAQQGPSSDVDAELAAAVRLFIAQAARAQQASPAPAG